MRELDLAPPVVVADLDLGLLEASDSGPVRFKPLSPFPRVRRDLAFIVKKETTWDHIVGVLKKLQDPLLQDFELFDVYEGKGVSEDQRSLAFTLTFGSPERTLTDEEVEASLKHAVAEIQKSCAAQLRGEL